MWWRGCHWWASERWTNWCNCDGRLRTVALCFFSSVSFKWSQLTLACLRQCAHRIKHRRSSSTEDLRTAIDHQAPPLIAWNTQSFIRVRFWRKTTPRPRNENTDPISSLSKHGSALGFDAGHQWALQVPAAIVWKVLFLWRGSERRSSRAKWNCCHFELIHLPTELRAGERKASSSRHNCVWRRKVRPRFPLIPDTETKTVFL